MVCFRACNADMSFIDAVVDGRRTGKKRDGTAFYRANDSSQTTALAIVSLTSAVELSRVLAPLTVW